MIAMGKSKENSSNGSNGSADSGGAAVTPTREEPGHRSATSSFAINSVPDENSLVPAASSTILRENLTHREAGKLFLSDFLSNLAFASWFFAFMLYFVSFCSNKAKVMILNEMEKLDPYAMTKLQGINFISTLFTSTLSFLVKLRFSKEFEKADFSKTRLVIFPLSSTIIKMADDFHSTPITQPLKNLTAPAYFLLLFTLLNYATFIFGNVIKHDELEIKSKFYSVIFREANMDPPTAVMMNALTSIMIPMTLNILYVVGNLACEKISRLFCKREHRVGEQTSLLHSRP
jgi:hypothetical protein